MVENKELLLSVIKGGSLFDFMDTDGYNYTKTDLIDIIKELDYAITHNGSYTKGMVDDLEENL